jgi:hypothetical protein
MPTNAAVDGQLAGKLACSEVKAGTDERRR